MQVSHRQWHLWKTQDIIVNMPPELMSTFVSLLANNSEYYPKVAMVVDIRSGYVFEKIIASIDSVEQYGYTCKIVYLDINDTEALKRLHAESILLQISLTVIFKMLLIMKGRFWLR